MLADLKEYRPAKIDFVLDDKVKEEFKDVMVLCKGAKSSKEVLKVFREKFNCLFPEGELATRQYDAHEIAMIREEYCPISSCLQRKQFVLRSMAISYSIHG